MAVAEWWSQNGKYVKAWGCHALVFALLNFGVNSAFKHFEPFQTMSFREPAVVAYFVLSNLVHAALSFYLFRILVLSFVVRKEAWSADVQKHPYRPYVVGWLSYIVLNLGVFVVTGIFLHVQLQIWFGRIGPWIVKAIRFVIAFFIFRMAVRKYVLPRAYGVI